ncbi:MAG: SEL1-like repeat protein [Campylobacterales bacterium]|nr:SEL1-like repeat protein [Campylobacterales bacterium]
MSVVCQQCRTANLDNALFCKNCGSKIETINAETPNNSNDKTSQTTSANDSKFSWLSVFLIIVLIFVTFHYASFFKRPYPAGYSVIRCELGNASYCNDVGDMFYNGRYVRGGEDRSEAAEYYWDACDGGYVVSCNKLGNMYYNADGVIKDHIKASNLYKKACDNGNKDACNNLANMYYNGQGVKTNKQKAVLLYQNACDGGNALGCNSAGNIYYNGDGVIKDYFKSLNFYKKACESGNQDGCNGVGFMYNRGYGVEQNYAEALNLYTKSCDNGNSVGCNNLGVMYELGQGININIEKAKVLYKKSCDDGYDIGCSNYSLKNKLGDWRFPTDSDYKLSWLDFYNSQKLSPFHIQVDFDKNGIKDDAWIMINTKNNTKYALYVFMNNSDKIIKLEEGDSFPPQWFVIKLASPVLLEGEESGPAFVFGPKELEGTVYFWDQNDMQFKTSISQY